MLLGKRPRPPMRRTTSMKALSVEELLTLQELPVAAVAPGGSKKQTEQQQRSMANSKPGGGAAAYDNSSNPNCMNGNGGFVMSPRGSSSSSRPRRNSGDFLMDASHFLRSCTLCKRLIAPGRDIYMYRGDTAYCSMECRQQQVNLDEKKEKCSVRSIKKEALPAASEASANGETAAAA